jgi:hypothetical protein
MSCRRLLCTALGVVGLVACGGAPTEPRPIVSFTIDAPYCGGPKLFVQFSIDSVIIGTDSLNLGMASRPGNLSQPFTATVGTHTVSARVIGTFLNNYSWPEKKMKLSAGQAFTDSLPFYCS